MTAPTATSVRAGDRDREGTANLLGQALAQGYLAMDEYESRLQATFAAHTTAELRRLVTDLPLTHLRRNDPQRQAARRRAAQLGVRIHLGAYLAMVVIVLTVWLAVGLTAGAWYFWPIWPILGAGIGLASHAIPVRVAVPGLCHARPAIDSRGPLSGIDPRMETCAAALQGVTKTYNAVVKLDHDGTKLFQGLEEI
jgi:hypothetical protein